MSLSILNDSARDATERYFARIESVTGPAASELDEAQVVARVNEIRAAIRDAHQTNIRFVIWVGTHDSVNDKAAMNAVGLMKGGPMFYWLDSADPEKLQSIVDNMQHRAQEPIAKLLPATLVVSVAAGEVPHETVLNREKLAFLYDKFRIDRNPNFVELERDSTLYPLALAGREAKDWIAGSVLSEAETAEARKLGAFLRAQGEAGRDKVTLFLPRSWNSIAAWTKNRFEARPGVKIVVDEHFNGRTYHKATSPKQDRIFVAVQRKGEAHPEATGITALRSAGYPIVVVTFSSSAQLSRYMQFMATAADALQSVRIADETLPVAAPIQADAKLSGTWEGLRSAKKWRGAISPETPESLANTLRDGAERRKFSFGEMTFFGDMRYSEDGKLFRKALETGGQRLFRVKLKMPVDINEGPAMSRGDGFSILIIAEEQGRYSTANYDGDYNVVQFLAARAALERKRRMARAILVKDLSAESIAALEAFFSETAALLEIQ